MTEHVWLCRCIFFFAVIYVCIGTFKRLQELLEIVLSLPQRFSFIYYNSNR